MIAQRGHERAGLTRCCQVADEGASATVNATTNWRQPGACVRRRSAGGKMAASRPCKLAEAVRL